MNPNRYISKKLKMRRPEALPYTGHLSLATDRNLLAEIFCELGYKVGAEIGVMKGVYSEILLSKNPGLKLYCIDPWVSGQEDDGRGQWFLKHVSQRLAKYNFEIIRKLSKDALLDIPDESLDFVYIDAMHDFDNVMFDIIEWSKKVRSGGMVSGHDFEYVYDVGVIQAVEGFTKGNNIRTWFVTREFPSSWFWIKSY